jgi:hypothetical protein
MSDWLQPRYGDMSLGYALQWLTPFILAAFLFQAAAAWTLRKPNRAPPAP